MQIKYFYLLRDAELSDGLVEDSVGQVDGDVCPGGAGQHQGGRQPAQRQHPGAGRGGGGARERGQLRHRQALVAGNFYYMYDLYVSTNCVNMRMLWSPISTELIFI